MNELLNNIKAAAKNPKVKGIYLSGGELSGGYASMKEIRDALNNKDALRNTFERIFNEEEP